MEKGPKGSRNRNQHFLAGTATSCWLLANCLWLIVSALRLFRRQLGIAFAKLSANSSQLNSILNILYKVYWQSNGVSGRHH